MNRKGTRGRPVRRLLKATGIGEVVDAHLKAHRLLRRAVSFDAMGMKECVTGTCHVLCEAPTSSGPSVRVQVCGSYPLKAAFFRRRPVNYFVGVFEQLLVARYAIAICSGMP
jgi:hypothetical protein